MISKCLNVQGIYLCVFSWFFFVSFALNFYFPSFYVCLCLCLFQIYYSRYIGYWGIESDVRGGGYDLPPSCGWPCSVENILILKPREAHSTLALHRVTCEWGQL